MKTPCHTVLFVLTPKPRLHDTTCCQTGCHTGCQTELTTGWTFVYTIQPAIKPVVQPVWQPVWQPVALCKRGIIISLLRRLSTVVFSCCLTNNALMKYITFISERELTCTFAICCRPSVCRLSSVTFVRRTQAVQIFGNISTALGTLAIHWHSLKFLWRSSQGTLRRGS